MPWTHLLLNVWPILLEAFDLTLICTINCGGQTANPWWRTAELTFIFSLVRHRPCSPHSTGVSFLVLRIIRWCSDMLVRHRWRGGLYTRIMVTSTSHGAPAKLEVRLLSDTAEVEHLKFTRGHNVQVTNRIRVTPSFNPATWRSEGMLDETIPLQVFASYRVLARLTADGRCNRQKQVKE